MCQKGLSFTVVVSTKYTLERNNSVYLHLGRTAQISSHLSCVVAFIHFTTWPVSLAFLACCSVLFYLWVREVKVELKFLLTPSFPPCNPWPAVARFLVSGRCEAHLRQSRHALWLHLSPNMSAWWAAVVLREGVGFFMSLSQSEDKTQHQYLQG